MKQLKKGEKLFFCIKCAPFKATILRVNSDRKCTRCGKPVKKNRSAAYILERRVQLREWQIDE